MAKPKAECVAPPKGNVHFGNCEERFMRAYPAGGPPVIRKRKNLFSERYSRQESASGTLLPLLVETGQRGAKSLSFKKIALPL